MTRFSLLCLLLFGFHLSSAAQADILAFVIDESGLPYSNSPSNYQNSPSNYQNSPSNYQNSSGNYKNSSSNYQNSSSNYQNGVSGKRRIYSDKNEWLGYYTIPQPGMINFYSTSGERVFYHPANKNTRGVFFSDDAEWAGMVGKIDGRFSVGLTQNAYYFLLSKQRR